jgi:hypothetical protein
MKYLIMDMMTNYDKIHIMITILVLIFLILSFQVNTFSVDGCLHQNECQCTCFFKDSHAPVVFGAISPRGLSNHDMIIGIVVCIILGFGVILLISLVLNNHDSSISDNTSCVCKIR